ncbi:MAG: hypothetical protein J6C42_04075, partial [Clostridia bacterium]|nr:hypothetical protein [Clostridia bacterium]
VCSSDLFPRTIFEEIQTNLMSADGINDMATHKPKKIPFKQKICTVEIPVAVQKGFGRGLGKPFPQKGFPKKSAPTKFYSHKTIF